LLTATRPAGIALAFVVIATVTAGVIVNLVRGRTDIDCGCGGIEGRQRLSWALVARNAVLMLAVLACLHESPARAWTWLDYATLAIATVALYVLYACASQLIANRPNLADLRSHA
jgi:hypothetical protein